ncbi:MAG: YifB family Mg chelatase-like AAA ATPase [Gammaproteobacteria bacterium]|nr:YifB family Mg chelatase-like AAA ATPase [Gammaproteobacteria bacterium]
MSLAVVHTRAQNGIEAPPVSVEVHLSNGLPSLSMVGLPEAAVKESKDRVRSAILNSRFEFPARRITINLAPADLPKEGGRFDLAIAIGILAASGQIPLEGLEKYEFIGELALTGSLRSVRGILPAAIQTARTGRTLLVASANAMEARLVSEVELRAADHLLEVCAHLCGQQTLPLWDEQATDTQEKHAQDMEDVRAQPHAKRALEIAAAGGHSLLMVGPPGTGKTMLASRLPGILPPMTEPEALETAALQSISEQGFTIQQWRKRPFRAPHHTASGVALVGGGSHPRPGEISLANNGVMFLDELPEFDRRVLEVLREPLESGRITISRAARQAEFPSRFQLVAAMNPCPCGYLGHSNGRCRCSPDQIQRYRNRISGPLLDRIDMHIEVPTVPIHVMQKQSSTEEENSQLVQQRVVKARDKQLQRNQSPNCMLNNKQVEQHCRLETTDQQLIERAIDQLGLSARAYHRILKVARTIADLAEAEQIQTAHVTEAISYRRLDRMQMN